MSANPERDEDKAMALAMKRAVGFTASWSMEHDLSWLADAGHSIDFMARLMTTGAARAVDDGSDPEEHATGCGYVLRCLARVVIDKAERWEQAFSTPEEDARRRKAFSDHMDRWRKQYEAAEAEKAAAAAENAKDEKEGEA